MLSTGSGSACRAALQGKGRQALEQLLAIAGVHQAPVIAIHMGLVFLGAYGAAHPLDLPGALCESLFITKLPFAPPDDPVGEARAEWLRSSGRNPFNELVVPATAIRLAQWVGRAISTEEDQAHGDCYDRSPVHTNPRQHPPLCLTPFALLRLPARCARPCGKHAQNRPRPVATRILFIRKSLIDAGSCHQAG